MNTPKRQHYIPRLHLKRFTGQQPKGQVWVYDKETGDVRSGTPENTAVESHFYSIPTEDSTKDTCIEEYLASVESLATPVYEELLDGNVPPSESQERANFSIFLALMFARTPAMRRMHAEITSRGRQIHMYAYAANATAFNGLVKRYEKAEGIELSEEDRAKVREGMLDPSQYVIEVTRESTLKALGVADRLAPLFLRMTWSVIVPESGFFITCDNPLKREVDPRTRHPIYGDYGFLNKTAVIAFPLSPKRLLAMRWDKAAPAFAQCKKEFVDGVNMSLAANAERFLYSHLRHKHVSKLAQRFRGTKPTMTTSGFGPKTFAATKVVRRLTD